MNDIALIDDGSALCDAKAGDLSAITKRLRDNMPMNDATRKWIADRLENPKTAKQKTGQKPDKDEHYARIERYVMFRWLVDVEGEKRGSASVRLSKIYSGKPDTLRKDFREMEEKSLPLNVLAAALGIEGDEENFRATGLNEYRPAPLRLALIS